MLLWTVRRIAYAAAVVVLIAFVTYGGFRLVRPDRFPGDPLASGTWRDVTGVFEHFDFGRAGSIKGHPKISGVFGRYWSADLWLLAGGLGFGVLGGIGTGILCSRRPRSLISRFVQGASTVIYCTPVAVMGLGLLLLFNPLFGKLIHIPYILDADPSFAQPWDDPWAFLRTLFVPWLVLGAPLGAMCLRLTLSGIVDAQEDEYIRTAVAKGLSERQVLRRHSAPITYLSTGSFVSISIPLLVTNAVLIEHVFSIPGFFQFTYQATGHIDVPPARGDPPPPDYQLLQAIGMWSAVLIVLLTVIADYLLVRIDPRVRTAQPTP